MSVPSPLLVAIGNPLLDITANVGEDMFQRYGVKPGNATLATPEQLPIYTDIKNFPVEYTAGGAAQNTIRAAQWMSQTKGSTAYIGCIGNDENGKTLKDAAESAGVETHYLIDSVKPTGTCAVLVHSKERSLIANLGAAEAYKQEHFDSDEIQTLLNKSKVLYCTGFLLTHSPHVLVKMGQLAAKQNKCFVMNISAVFIVDYFFEQLSSVLPFTDYVICNEDEAAAFGKKMGWGNDLEEVAQKLSAMPKENTQRSRSVIFTQGARQTVVYSNGTGHKFSPVPVKKEEIVDTNGAGDSFVGGYLSKLIFDKSLEECVAAGHYCASECIKRSGATYPEKVNFSYP